VLSQEILRLDAGQTYHLRNLKEIQAMIPIAVHGKGFQGPTGKISSISRKPLSYFIRDAKRNVDSSSLAGFSVLIFLVCLVQSYLNL
jgi:hypothetical protein